MEKSGYLEGWDSLFFQLSLKMIGDHFQVTHHQSWIGKNRWTQSLQDAGFTSEELKIPGIINIAAANGSEVADTLAREEKINGPVG
jgi:hypothetical protein